MNITKLNYDGVEKLAGLLERSPELHSDFTEFVWDDSNFLLMDYAKVLGAGNAFRVSYGLDTETDWVINDISVFLHNCHNFIAAFGDCAVSDKDITHAQKLLGTNLADWYVRQIAEKITDCYFTGECRYLYDALIMGDNSKMAELCATYGELFLDCELYYTDKDGCVLKLRKIA